MIDTILLVRKAQKGDSEAFIKLFQNYEHTLYNTAYKFLHNEQDVADALQETALIAFEKIAQLQQPRYFNTWLCRILINQCKRHYAAKPAASADSRFFAEHTEDTEAAFILNELLKTLDQNYQIALVLYYYNGYTVKEISKILAEPVGTIKSRLARGRALLQKAYLSNGGSANEEF